MGEGQALHYRNIPFPLLRLMGIPAKDKDPREPLLLGALSQQALSPCLPVMGLLKETDVEVLGGAGWAASGKDN